MKYYAVKVGRFGPDIYNTWNECKSSVEGFSGAKFKSFNTEDEAKEYLKQEEDILRTWPEGHHICCDGASSLKKDTWEFKLVWTDTKEIIYQSPVYKGGTNNTAEFCGLCTAFKYIVENNLKDCRIYTDSITAISWFEKGRCSSKSSKTSSETRKMLIDWEEYLEKEYFGKEDYDWIEIIHWNNHIIGENPADFGNK